MGPDFGILSAFPPLFPLLRFLCPLMGHTVDDPFGDYSRHLNALMPVTPRSEIFIIVFPMIHSCLLEITSVNTAM